LHKSIISLELQFNLYLADIALYVIEYFAGDRFVNGEIVKTSPEGD